jgi:hypothetical protein
MNCPIDLCGHVMVSGYDMIEHLRIYHAKEVIVRALTRKMFENEKEKCHLWHYSIKGVI